MTSLARIGNSTEVPPGPQQVHLRKSATPKYQLAACTHAHRKRERERG